MSEAIFIQNGPDLIRMEPESYVCEDEFQQLLANFPDLLAGEQINRTHPRRWLFIAREAAIPSEEGGSDRWSLDHLFLDQDAIPTLVEVKRKSDTRLRREVVGQMMDYAANAAVYWSGEVLQARFTETAQRQGQDPEQVLARFLGGGDPEHFWQTVQLNLRSGKIRLVFVADYIPSELQRIVEFLNEHMTPTEVLALEIRRFSGGGLSTHIPRLIGQTSEAQITKGTSIASKRRTWNDITFFEDADQRLTSDEVEFLRSMLNAVKNELLGVKIDWGTGSSCASFTPKVSDISRYGLFTIRADGYLQLKLNWFVDGEDSKLLHIFLNELAAAGVSKQFNPAQSYNLRIDEWQTWGNSLCTAFHTAVEKHKAGEKLPSLT